MSDELNNSFEPSNEETDTPKATLNGVDFGSVEVAGPKKGLVAAIAVGAVALIVALICVIVFLMKKPSTDDERVSSVSTTNSASETSASDETPASETESDVSENDPDEAYGFPETVDYSFGLTEEGFIKDADLSTVADLNLVGTEIPFSAVDYIDDKVDADILSVAQQYAFYDDDPTLTVENGHTINLNYSGSIDGVKFDGGTAEYQELVIGSGSFIDNFEEQLIGAHPGDDVTVTVTFPENYGSADLAGKEAVFECKVNSIYRIPEVDDAFVQKYLNDFADNLADLKTYVKEQGMQSNLESYLATQISGLASAEKIPKAYEENLKTLLKYNDKSQFDQYKTYLLYYGYYDAASMTFEEYAQVSPEEYDSIVAENASKQAQLDLTYESIFKNAGLSVSEDDYAQIKEYYGGDSAVSSYGEPYLRQIAIKYSVINYLADNAVIVGATTE